MSEIEKKRKRKNIIFDIGNVLLTWNPENIINQAFKNTEYSGKFTPSMFRLADWLAFDQGLISEKEVAQKMQAQWGISLELAQHALYTAKESLTPKKDSIELLKELDQRKKLGEKLGEKLELYCLTNMSEEFFNYLFQKYDFFNLFAHITVSGKIKLLKPDPKIYHYLLDHNQILAHESILIDDMKENIESAIRTGLHGIEFSEINDCRRQLYQFLD